MTTVRTEAQQNVDTLGGVGAEIEGARESMDALKAALTVGDLDAVRLAALELDRRIQEMEASLDSNPAVQRNRRAFKLRQGFDGVFEELDCRHDIPAPDLDRFLGAAQAALELLPAG